MKWKGIALAPGVAVGHAFVVQSRSAPPVNRSISDPSEVELEQRKFDHACAVSLVELKTLAYQTEKQLGKESGAIFRAHALLVEDPILLTKVKSLIVEKTISAESAVELPFASIRSSAAYANYVVVLVFASMEGTEVVVKIVEAALFAPMGE